MGLSVDKLPSFLFFGFFWWHWGLNSGPHTCALEPLHQSNRAKLITVFLWFLFVYFFILLLTFKKATLPSGHKSIYLSIYLSIIYLSFYLSIYHLSSEWIFSMQECVVLENTKAFSTRRPWTSFQNRFFSWDQVESEHNGKDDIYQTHSVSLHVVEGYWVCLRHQENLEKYESAWTR
jgi:hypothetical protein